MRALLLVALLAGSAAAEEDPRSRVLLRSSCETEASARELTLFANGTVRLREGMGATRTMRLSELGDSELRAYINRLEDIAFDDLAPQAKGIEGDLVERCELELELPEEEPKELVYGQFDSIPHGFRHVLLVVDDLLLVAQSERLAGERVRAFEPELGDFVVRRRDSARFEVVGFSIEGTGVEIRGIDQPVTIYILKDQLLTEFEPDPDPGLR